MIRKKKQIIEQIFRDHCIVHDGTLNMCRLHVSGEVWKELKGFYQAYRDVGCDFRNGNRERFFSDFAVHSSRLCLDDGRKTVLRRDIVMANGFIHKEDYMHG